MNRKEALKFWNELKLQMTDAELLKIAESQGWKQIRGGEDDPFGAGHLYDFWINRKNDRIVDGKTKNTAWSTQKLLVEIRKSLEVAPKKQLN